LNDSVQIVETLRDAWQGLPRPVPTERKVAFIGRLLQAGFPRLDIGSFVSKSRVPAMADTDEVVAAVAALPGLRAPVGAAGGGTAAQAPRPRFTALVASEAGLERLLASPLIDEVLYPFSFSERFQRRNTERSREEAFALLATLSERAHAAGRTVYATISMAFGNNEGEPFEPAELRTWVQRLHHEGGVDRVGLADTTAQASAETIARVYDAVMLRNDWAVPGAHLHVTPENQGVLVAAALAAGCRDFDAALGALGGCQFAKGAVSNVSTAPLVRQLREAGLQPDVPEEGLAQLEAEARALAAAG
jgi:hydroxymethylglutaryl-CoA lyase